MLRADVCELVQNNRSPTTLLIPSVVNRRGGDGAGLIHPLCFLSRFSQPSASSGLVTVHILVHSACIHMERDGVFKIAGTVFSIGRQYTPLKALGQGAYGIVMSVPPFPSSCTEFDVIVKFVCLQLRKTQGVGAKNGDQEDLSYVGLGCGRQAHVARNSNDALPRTS